MSLSWKERTVDTEWGKARIHILKCQICGTERVWEGADSWLEIGVAADVLHVPGHVSFCCELCAINWLVGLVETGRTVNAVLTEMSAEERASDAAERARKMAMAGIDE